jgi:phage repressor protein C with HTH and peptisase S24 domain
MPASIVAAHQGRYSILEADLPASGLTPIGVLLQDPQTDRLYLRLRRDWDEIAPDDEVLPLLQEDLDAKAGEMGAERLLSWLEENASTDIRVTDRRNTLVDNFERTLNRLYTRHIHSTVRARITHVPRYTLRVAAGRFLDNEEVEADDYEEVPPDLTRVSGDLFAGEIVGTSMEPLIPNGSVCLFRLFGAGSRQGKLVLVEELGRGANDRYTVKRYKSVKVQREDGSWEHNAIRLEPLNPEHEAWYLIPGEEERYRIIAEFVRVLY